MCDPCTILLFSKLLGGQPFPGPGATGPAYVQFEFTSDNVQFDPGNPLLNSAIVGTPQLAVSSRPLGSIYVYYVDPAGPRPLVVTLTITTPSPGSTTNAFTFNVPAASGNNNASGTNVFVGNFNASLVPGSILIVRVTSTVAGSITLAPIVVALGP
jgi:hypothetical protein